MLIFNNLLTMKKLIALLIITIPFHSKGQIDLSTILEAGVEDATTLMENYMEPVFLGFGYGVNNGWYNTAETHKLLGFDVTVMANSAFVPNSDQFFTINDEDYTNIRVVPTTGTNGEDVGIIRRSPTFLGPNLAPEELPTLSYLDDSGNEIARTSAPTGLGLEEWLESEANIKINPMPSAMVQLGLGLVKNTDLTIRFIPATEGIGTLSEREYEFSMFGIGVKHDIKQWIPGLKLVPFDFAGFVGWNKINATYFLDSDKPDQIADFNVSSFTLQGIISKKLWIFTPFAGLGIATTATNFALLGDYDGEVDADLPTDPIDFRYSSAGPRFNVGFRLRLFILNLHVDYALQKYNTLTAGVGIGIR
jgi:hypothetical protein